MKTIKKTYLGTAVLGAALALFPVAGSAQNRGDDRGKHADDRDHGRDDRRDNHSEYHFRPEDRSRFSSHYKSNLRQFEKHPDRRHAIRAGERLPSDYRKRLKAVPLSYYRDMPPPPPGYRLGYYDGYVVAYNPTTQIVADVLDLVNAAVNR